MTGTVADAGELDAVRTRLAALARPHTPADVADAMRAEGQVVSDRALLDDGRSVAQGQHRRRTVGGAAAPTRRHRRPGQRSCSRCSSIGVTGWNRSTLSFATDGDVRRLAQRLAAAVGRRLDDVSTFRRRPTSRRNPGARGAGLGRDTRHLPVAAGTGGPDVHAGGLRQPAAPSAPAAAEVLRQVVGRRLAFLISGGTGSGKTTLLAALLGLVPPDQRLVIVEDSRELNPQHPHVVRMEGRPVNAEQRGAITLTDLVRQALRMRPDRLVVGEVRGAEIADLLTAMNTGHEGGCGTVHANSAGDVPARLEALAALGGMGRTCAARATGRRLGRGDPHPPAADGSTRGHRARRPRARPGLRSGPNRTRADLRSATRGSRTRRGHSGTTAEPMILICLAGTVIAVLLAIPPPPTRSIPSRLAPLGFRDPRGRDRAAGGRARGRPAGTGPARRAAGWSGRDRPGRLGRPRPRHHGPAADVAPAPPDSPPAAGPRSRGAVPRSPLRSAWVGCRVRPWPRPRTTGRCCRRRAARRCSVAMWPRR